ncbi:MAG: hypothetical protein AAF799_46510 [Myxococcota bacterium]
MTYSIRLILASSLLSGCLVDLGTVGEVPVDSDGMTTTEGAAEETAGAGEEESGPGATSMVTGATASGGALDTGGEESGAATATGGPGETGMAGTGGDCFYMEHDCNVNFSLEDCGAPDACDMVIYQLDSLFPKFPVGFQDLDAADCVLDGLAAGEVGVYQIRVQDEVNFRDNYRFEVLPDGRVLRQIVLEHDKSCDATEQLTELREPDYFTQCQAETDEALLIDCLLGAADPMVCLPGETGEIC